MAPEVGLEPTTNRLTADRSTTELLRKKCERKVDHTPDAESILLRRRQPAMRASTRQPALRRRGTVHRNHRRISFRRPLSVGKLFPRRVRIFRQAAHHG